jgi:hypothetical protein
MECAGESAGLRKLIYPIYFEMGRWECCVNVPWRHFVWDTLGMLWGLSADALVIFWGGLGNALGML